MATREEHITNMQSALEKAKMDPNVNPYIIIRLERDIDRLVKYTEVTIEMKIADIQEEMSYLTPEKDQARMQHLTKVLANLKAHKKS